MLDGAGVRGRFRPRPWWRLATLVAAALLAGQGAGCGEALLVAQEATRVERIIDGDTLVLRGGERVRLLQVDAPEAGWECYARAAARELARLAPPGATVVLETDPGLDRVDAYGRLLRYVVANGVNVNLELVRRGAATPYFYRGERGRYASRLLRAVRAAREARRGMWGACRVSWAPTRQVETRFP